MLSPWYNIGRNKPIGVITTEEVWKDVVGCDGFYRVSNTGKVLSVDWNRTGKPKELRPFDNGGYRRGSVYVNGVRKHFLVHRLVAEAFIENPGNLPCVNHVDGDKSNNCVSNLEWVSVQENVHHAIKNGLRPPNVVCKRKRGRENPLCKPVFQYDKDGHLIKRWETSFDIEAALGYDRKVIIACCGGHKPSYRGFVWRHY